jgi:hypothetical protein
MGLSGIDLTRVPGLTVTDQGMRPTSGGAAMRSAVDVLAAGVR